MRCGFVRLVTRRCPYDVKIKRKAWTSGQRPGETAALTSEAEPKLIGRYCAHKMCRLFEKSSKIVCKMLSASDINNRKMSEVKSHSFDHLKTSNIKSVKVKNFNDFTRNNVSVRTSKSRINNVAPDNSQNSKIIRLQNYSTNDVSNSNASKSKASRPSHVLSKHKFCPYKRYSAQRITSKRSVSNNQQHKNYNRYVRGAILRNKVTSPRNLYSVQSPLFTNLHERDERYINELKHNSCSRYDNIENSDIGQGFLDHKVLNHLNETSFLSLCGCDICDQKLKDYDKKNYKINRLLQNKISKILNYCKKKNPFYKIYSQTEKNKEWDYLREFSMCGINGWLNYLDACECTDWSQYKQREKTNSTHNKCVNTTDDQIKATDSANKCPMEQPEQMIYCNSNCRETDQSPKDFKLPNVNGTCINNDKQKVQREGVLNNKDDSMTQTTDLTEPQVTNYYYITNNTLNTNCCCKDECFNETDSVTENNRREKKCKHDCNQTKGYNQNACSNEINSNKHDGSEKRNGTRVKANTELKTTNKAYDVIMKPVNQNNILKQSNSNVDELIKPFSAELKACNANNFEYYDCESYQPYHVHFGRGDEPQQSTLNYDEKVLNFDEFMEMKCREFEENPIIENFRYLNDIQFNDMTKKTLKEEHRKYDASLGNDRETTKENILRKPSNPIAKETDNSPMSESERLKSSENTYSIIKIIEDDKDPSSPIDKRNEQEIREEWMKCDNLILGPTDHINQYMANIDQRYKEKVRIISRGPDFSQFPPSNWRDSVLENEKKLSQTFDVSNPYVGSKPIKISEGKTRDLSKYSEINIAIEKVKKKIHDIINESNENITVHKRPTEKLIKHQRNKQANYYRKQSSKRLKPSGYNQTEPTNNVNYRVKSNEKRNCAGGRKENIKCNKKYEMLKYDKKYEEFIKQSNNPPSSVHLNEIIEAMKENKNADECCDEPVTNVCKRQFGTAGKIKSEGYQVYRRPLAGCSSKKIPRRNNIFVGNPYSESIFGIINKESLLNVASISRSMSTSSKYRPFLRYAEHKTNKKQCKSNFMDDTIFSTDNFVSQGHDNEKTTKARKKEAYLKYMENKINGTIDGDREYEESPPDTVANKKNLNLYKEGYVDYQKSREDEFFDKSIEIFSQNNGKERKEKTEYSPATVFPGGVDRYRLKHFSGRKRFNRNENQIDDNITDGKRWKIWDPKVWENGADNCRTETVSKGFCNTETDDVNCRSPEGNEIIFNERLEKTVQTVSELDDNCTGTKAVMNNDTGRRFDRFNCRPNNRSSVDNSYCINVGDLGLNFTSFALGKAEERENKKGKGSVERNRREDQGKSVHGSESRINNVGVANMSMSRQADLHLRETRTVGLRPCNKNEVPPISFRIRKSFLTDSKNTLRPVTTSNALYRRQVSSGNLDSGNFTSDIADKLKNIEKIDQVDYTREEKCLSEKEAVETIKIKETYLSPSNQNEISLGAEAFSETKNYPGIGIGMCSTELEKRTKNKKTGDAILKKQITEEMNVAGLFPEGKKSVHGKAISVFAKPKTKLSPNNRNNGDDQMKTTDFKDPITVQVLYETTTDHSVEEHIDKAKRKVYIGDIKRKQRPPPIKLFSTNEFKNGKEANKTPEPVIKNEKKSEPKFDDTENELDENKLRVWKKYDPKYKDTENKKYYVELKTLNKNKWNGSDDPISDIAKDPERGTMIWQAPRNRVFDKLTNRDGLKNEWMQGKEISSPNKNLSKPELGSSNLLDDRNVENKDFSARCDTNANATHIDHNTSQETKKKFELIKKLSTFNNLGDTDSTKSLKEGTEKAYASRVADGSKTVSFNEAGSIANISKSKDTLKVESTESKIEEPTTGETKYEIDSDSFNDNTGVFDENEKLVITHFKQFLRPDTNSVNKSDGDKNREDFVLEASMLKVTMIHESGFNKNANKNASETQSIENLSNEVERELNDMVSPYIRDLVKVEQSQENKGTDDKNISLFKPNEYFLNMLNPNSKTFGRDQKITKARNIENLIENRPTTIEPIGDAMDDSGIKVRTDSRTEDVSNKGDPGTDLAHTLRASIEKLYMKQVSYITPEGRNDLAHQMRASMEKLYIKDNLARRAAQNKTETLTNAGETEEEMADEDLPSSKSSGIQAKVAEKDSSINDTDSTNKDEQVSEKTKTPRKAARYESIVKELKKMFVREEGVQTEASANLEVKSSKLVNEEPEVMKDLELTENKENDDTKEETVKKQLSSVELKSDDDTGKQEALNSITEISNESEKLTTDDKTTMTKSTAKSYYSYDSTLKPPFLDATKNKNADNENKNSTDSTQVKGEARESQMESSDNKNYSKNKSDIPLSQPAKKSTGTSLRSHDSTVKTKIQEKENEKVLDEKRNIEKTLPPIEDKRETHEQQQTQLDKGKIPHTSKEFKAKSLETSTEKSRGKVKEGKKIPTAKPKDKKPKLSSSFYGYDTKTKPKLPKAKSDQNIAVKTAEQAPLIINKDEIKLPEREVSELNESNNLLKDYAIKSILIEDEMSKDTRETEEAASETKITTDNENENAASIEASTTIQDNPSKEEKAIIKNVEDSNIKLDDHETKETKDEISLKPIISDDGEIKESQTDLTKTKELEEIIPRLSKTEGLYFEKEESKAKKEFDNTKEPLEELKAQAEEKSRDLKLKDKDRKKPIGLNVKNLYSKEVIVEDAQEMPAKKKTEEIKQEKQEETEPVEEQFEILSSSFNQYEVKEPEQSVTKKMSPNLEVEKKQELSEQQVHSPEERKEKVTKQELTKIKKIAPIQEPKHFVPYEREKTDQASAIAAWEKEPTYMKNLRPSFFKLKKMEMRIKNYEENEKRFKNLRTLNKINSMSKVSDCSSCQPKEKWVADMCCSLEKEKEKAEEGNDEKPSSQEESTRSDHSTSKATILRSGRGYRSAEWPDNLTRKREAVIKQPSTPKPPWRN